ncbi:Pre-mRNA cleavage complex II protein Clp1 [Musa troglodytarum]|uniref:Pre-mRNA cleavage complex II protein Clp1 n=1 Tax=Musa troglodytarum TaxID=320322 RepID=A0A9E7GMU6_9LILI|nr:Pre-mRNA cleavage complex II protein Clp1 [Musa troglodytarum]
MVGGRESGAGASAGEVIIPLDWAEVAEEISRASSPPPVVFICGPKNSGKSTFSRYLLNVLLPRHGKVGYLDTDVGQPEFSSPGCLSLTLVDQTIPGIFLLLYFILYLMNPCNRATERCFFFGDVSSKSDPKAYLDCTFNLYDYFIRVHYQPNELNHPGKALPLIINTPGWVKGTGFDLLVEKLRYISPRQVVQIRISVESKNLPGSTFWLDNDQQEPHIFLLNSARHNYENQSILVRKDACRMRDQRLFDYFKQCFPSNLNILTNKELAHALAAIAPYVVPFAKIKVVHLHCQVPSSEIFHSLNATIVGLAVSSDVPAKSRSDTPWCVGLGIVRAIDAVRGLLYVITPVPFGTLQKVDLLLQGFIEIPTGLLQFYISGCNHLRCVDVYPLTCRQMCSTRYQKSICKGCQLGFPADYMNRSTHNSFNWKIIFGRTTFHLKSDTAGILGFRQQMVDAELIQNEASHRPRDLVRDRLLRTRVWSSGPEVVLFLLPRPHRIRHAAPNSQQQEEPIEASRRGDRKKKRDPQREHQQQQGDGDRGRLLLDPLAAGGGDGGESEAEAREHVRPDEQEEGEVERVCRVEPGSGRDGRVDTDANHRRQNQLPCRPRVW